MFFLCLAAAFFVDLLFAKRLELHHILRITNRKQQLEKNGFIIRMSRRGKGRLRVRASAVVLIIDLNMSVFLIRRRIDRSQARA